MLTVLVVALGACGGDDRDEGPPIARAPLEAQIMDGIRGTVGFGDAALCVEAYLDTKDGEELQRLANGGDRDLDEEFTDAVVGCVDG